MDRRIMSREDFRLRDAAYHIVMIVWICLNKLKLSRLHRTIDLSKMHSLDGFKAEG